MRKAQSTGFALLVAVPLSFLRGEIHAQGVLPPASGTLGTPGEIRTVEGRVLRGGGSIPEPVSGLTVVLHRISADSSGPVDSVRSSAGGGYRFRYRLEGPRSMYIVSARHSGVAYFTSPLREKAVSGPEADVVVFDTTSRSFPMTVRSRHFVIAPPDADGIRRVVDVFEVANDSARTLVSGSAGPATWRVRLPEGVSDPSSSGGDMPPDAFRFAGGNAELVVPFPPGARQLVLTYAMPAGASLTVPLEHATTTLEVLLEGGGATVSGAGLAAEAPVTMEGRSFQRFVASQVPAASTFSVSGGGGPGGRAGRLALLAVAAVAVASGIVLGRRARATALEVVVAGSPSDALAREIAALDHVYDAPGETAGPDREAYFARRAGLMARLSETLAVEDRETAR
jgi:hypothetical protein